MAWCLVLLATSCEDLVKVDPPRTELDRSSVFADDATANAALEGIYTDLAGTKHFIQGLYFNGISFINGMSADEYLPDPNEEGIALYENNLDAANERTSYIWEYGYKSIYLSNAVIEGLSRSDGVSMKGQFMGEAKFIRALNYFYLVNQFGDVPLVTTTDYRENMTISRAPVEQVYELIVNDLKEAQSLLTRDYSLWNGQRVRATRWAATALLARVYLYLGNWEAAEIAATEVIAAGNGEEDSLFVLEPDLNKVFLKNSSEAIWQLLPSSTDVNTLEGFVLNFYNGLGAPFLVSTGELFDAFEPNDLRQDNWMFMFSVDDVDYYHPYKYKVGYATEVIEYYIVLRLAEQYLIRAEARTRQGNIDGARADLDAIRHRAGLPDTEAADAIALLAAIEHERRVELFAESGHRWLDLKRWGRANAVLGGKPGWNDTDVLFPVPETEIEKNGNLKPQNDGY